MKCFYDDDDEICEHYAECTFTGRCPDISVGKYEDLGANNMKEYISKEYINNLLEYHLDHWCGPEYYTCSIIQDEINDAPDSEIIYFSHGRWLEYPNHKCAVQCSHCGLILENIAGCFRYCPNCGTIMVDD